MSEQARRYYDQMMAELYAHQDESVAAALASGLSPLEIEIRMWLLTLNDDTWLGIDAPTLGQSTFRRKCAYCGTTPDATSVGNCRNCGAPS